MTDDSSDDDWFAKDEEDIFRNFQSDLARRDNTEYIANQASTQELLKQIHLDALASGIDVSDPPGTVKIQSSQLAKILSMEPLDLFMHIMINKERYCFLTNQITMKDSQVRVLHYTQALKKVSKLHLPVFELEFLRSFADNIPLLTHYRVLIVKLFSPTAVKDRVWNDITQSLLSSMKYLLLRAHSFHLHNTKGRELIGVLKTHLTQCRVPEIINSPVCKELAKELGPIAVANNFQAVEYMANEFYPTLDELKAEPADGIAGAAVAVVPDSKNNIVGAYLSKQCELLRDDFMIPFRALVTRFRNKQNIETLLETGVLWPHVQIMLNPNFKVAKRYGLIFVDILGADRPKRLIGETVTLTKQERKFLEGLKNGTLVCFTSDCNFEDLIMATVTFTQDDTLAEGYFGIEIARQYNIANIYSKPLIMFESPAFLEPYYHVYNYLSNCNVDNFPMVDYFVNGVTTPNKMPKEYEIINDKMLNEKQNAAFRSALNNDLCLIQGPPGTGKTQITVDLIRTLIANRKEIGSPIIVVAYTNESIDKFLLKIAVHTDSILRFGSQARVPELAKYNARNTYDGSASLKRLYWVTNVEYKRIFETKESLQADFDGTDEAYQKILKAQNELSLVSEKLNVIRNIFQYYVARDKSIIAMTTTCAAKLNFLFHLLKCKIVIFEEAAEILESHILACLTPYTQMVTMIGDHKQLQPFTSSHEHALTNELNVSLFERLIKQKFELHVLDTQYRMRRNIADLLVPEIYPVLKSADVIDSYPDVRGMSKNLYFLTHSSEETQSDMSFTNDYESQKICELALHLLQVSQYTPVDIVILTPYLAQKENISQRLLKADKNAIIRVSTVDSFQGLESKIVLLSLVRSNSANSIGFLRHDNRICVALSRAKHGLYIIGNMTALVSDSTTWRAIDKKLSAENCIGLDFPLKLDK